MSLSELFNFSLFFLISGIGIAALTVLLDVLMPALIRRARANAAKMPVRSAIVGLVNSVFFGIITIALFSIADQAEADGGGGLLRLIGILVLVGLTAFLALGITAIARWLGERLMPEASAPRQMLAGILTLEFASLAPIVGWILVPLVTVLTGYGAVILALIWRKQPQ